MQIENNIELFTMEDRLAKSVGNYMAVKGAHRKLKIDFTSSNRVPSVFQK